MKYNQNYFNLCPFFGNSLIGQTRQRIFTHDGSNNADSRKDVLFWDFSHCTHLWVNPQKNWGAWMSVFKPNTRNQKRAYYQNNCIDSNQIFHSDKDHEMPFVSIPDTRITKPRWRTAAVLEKSKNSHISAGVNRFWRNLARCCSSTLLTVPLKIWNFENPR